MCLYVYECAFLERWVYVLCNVSCMSFFLPIQDLPLCIFALGPLERYQHKLLLKLTKSVVSEKLLSTFSSRLNWKKKICLLNLPMLNLQVNLLITKNLANVNFTSDFAHC